MKHPPYPNRNYKAVAHVWPNLIPTQLYENEKFQKGVFDKREIVVFGGEERMKDDFTNRIANPTSITLEDARYFVQQEVGLEQAEIILDFIEGREVTDIMTSI